jgi:colanic acid/amylovoran biosynthesis glycosyltransferase
MNIAFVVNTFPSVSETFILNQITGLIERGHAVSIFAHAPGRSEVNQPEIARYGLLERTHYLRAPKDKLARLRAALPLIAQGLRRQAGVLLQLLNPFAYGLEALTLTRLFQCAPFLRDFDILHCQYGPNGNFGAHLKALGVRGKLVTTFHGYDIRMGLEQGGEVYRELFARSDKLIAISDFNQQRLVEFGADPRKIVCHSVGIDVTVFARPGALSATAMPPVRVITVARLVEEKGLRFALHALARVRADQPGVGLDYGIIGEGPLRSELETLIRELRLSDCVHLLGAGDQAFIRERLWASHLFLLPSVAEVLPVSLMEAHAAGLPVVATDVGSVRAIVRDGVSGFVVPPGDAAALAEAVVRLATQPEHWPELGEAGRAHVAEHFNIHRLNDQLVQLYQHVLEGER